MNENDTASGKIVCLGEVMVRLAATGKQLLSRARELQVTVGGAEANVAVSLAHMGHRCSMVSALPDNVLGQLCLAELRGHGVNTAQVRLQPGRLGLYFLDPGAGLRAPEILYDRADSVFARARASDFDWHAALEGAGWLHVSGVTPALGPKSVELTQAALRAARAAGVRISFDCNYRAKLWSAWGGDAATTLRSCASQADLLFADERALAMIMGATLPGGDGAARFTELSRQLFAVSPQLQRVAATSRREASADEHEIGGLLATRNRTHVARQWDLRTIVDRIGSGDAFAAGLLHSLIKGADDAAALEFAVAAACLKHSIPGDFNLSSTADIEGLLDDRGFGVRR
jgi:2-dehydro-3-deoxygluconokinase